METNQSLPENAFRELREGEQYEPLMRADRTYPEVNAWSVAWGIPIKPIISTCAGTELEPAN